MAELRIVYTPDAKNFRIDNLIPYLVRYTADPSSERLRNSYQKLRAELPDLPPKVGVVTFDVITKAFHHKTLENSSTPYYPLEIFERVLALEGEGCSKIAIEYFMRETESLVLHYSVLNNPKREIRRMAIRIPFIQKFKEISSNLKEIGKLDRIADHVDIEHLKELIGQLKIDFEDVRGVYQIILKDFEQNKVSREFPLFYQHWSYSEHELGIVSLIDETEPLDSVKELFELAKKMGYKQTIDKFTKDSPKIDKFGETTHVDGLETLLQSLPQPKTIITDTYVVTLFPQLAEQGFSSHEFRL